MAILAAQPISELFKMYLEISGRYIEEFTVLPMNEKYIRTLGGLYQDYLVTPDFELAEKCIAGYIEAIRVNISVSIPGNTLIGYVRNNVEVPVISSGIRETIEVSYYGNPTYELPDLSLIHVEVMAILTSFDRNGISPLSNNSIAKLLITLYGLSIDLHFIPDAYIRSTLTYRLSRYLVGKRGLRYLEKKLESLVTVTFVGGPEVYMGRYITPNPKGVYYKKTPLSLLARFKELF